ncbi:unnamed protein product, partial [Urochloa humidicola]
AAAGSDGGGSGGGGAASAGAEWLRSARTACARAWRAAAAEEAEEARCAAVMASLDAEGANCSDSGGARSAAVGPPKEAARRRLPALSPIIAGVAVMACSVITCASEAAAAAGTAMKPMKC